MLQRLLALLAVLGLSAAVPAVPPAHERTRVVCSHDLPPLAGGRARVTVVEVTYGPGEASPAHSHPCALVGYVLAGAVRSQVDDEPAAVYRPGDTFFEKPHAAHRVSANASPTEDARFLATFICDGDAPLSAPLPDAGH